MTAISTGVRAPGAVVRMGIQTTALLVDAYRELNAKKLFWITMFLSGLVVSVFAGFGLNEKGLTFLWWEFPLPVLNSTIFPPASFYKLIFAIFGIPVWLTWVASVLALISTAGIFPDFLSGGSIELALSKPISRLRLFITKYLTGLLFVFLQVLVFTAACFMVIGLRGSRWDFALFLAVPIVVCFFSYLFCFCVLMGILTRSTIASVLLTCLFWVVVFAFNAADAVMLDQRVDAEIRVEQGEQRVVRAEKTAKENVEQARLNTDDSSAPTEPAAGDEMEAAHPPLKRYRDELVKDREALETWTWWSTFVFRAKTVLPKTGETVDLLNRYLLTEEERAMFLPKDDDSFSGDERGRVSQAEKARRLTELTQSRSFAWVVGSSLIFEAVVIGIGAVIFVRRDF